MRLKKGGKKYLHAQDECGEGWVKSNP